MCVEIDAFVDSRKDFIGKDEAHVPERQFCKFEIATGPGEACTAGRATQGLAGWGWSIPGDSPIHSTQDDSLVGVVTTAALGARTNRTVALGYLSSDAERDLSSDQFYVESFGQRWAAKRLGMNELPAIHVEAGTSADAGIAAAKQHHSL